MSTSFLEKLWSNAVAAWTLQIPYTSSTVTVFASLGCLWTLGKLHILARLSYLHFFRRTSLGRYLREDSSASWAFVTGASDGIGKGFAEELCFRGFNVVLHGRNEAKLEAVKVELQERWPQRGIKVLVLDAMTGAHSVAALARAVEEVKDLDITVLINNVGGSGGLKPGWLAFVERSAEDNAMFIGLNAIFSTHLTRSLLPQMIHNQPALVLNIGSVCSEVPSPYGSVYAGAKAYNKAWSRSLSLEMEAEGTTVEVITILVGEVSSGSQPQELNFFCPSSRRMASDSLDKVGCGDAVVWGYWPHQLQFASILKLPQRLMEKIILKMVLEEKSKEKAELQKLQQWKTA